MANYSFFLGQGGGGGGTGDFAVIKIEYPEGSEIQVTFDGDTIDAPDTSGVWIYGCDEAGTYTISIKNTTISKTVEITTQGQIENIWISPQIVNYALTYYLGNEFTDPSDAEKRYAIKTGGWNSEAYQGIEEKFVTALEVQSPENCRLFWFIKPLWKSTNRTVRCAISSYNMDKAISSATTGISEFNMSAANNPFTANDFIQLYRTNISTNWMKAQKENNQLKCLMSDNSYLSVFALGFFKPDDISGLSAYGSTIYEIYDNAISLFNDISALNWMVLNCTGEFMLTALNNTTFKNAMNASANKSILVANEHWNRFITLLSL